MANGRVMGSVDNIPARYLPLSIIREFDFDLDEFAFLHKGEALLYPIQYRNGHFLSFPPVGAAILATPFYLVPAWLDIAPESPHLPQVEKVAAAGIATLSVCFVLLTLMRLVSKWTAFIVAGLYALGTATFGVSSQSLWPIGSAQFLLALGLYFLSRGLSDHRYTAYAALPLAWAVVCRPSTALISLILGLYVWQRQRQQFLRFFLFACPAIAFLLVYNAAYMGSPFLPPGYVSAGGHVLARPENFNTPSWKGLLGLLVSPSVGFFVYSPVFLFALAGLYRRCRARDPLALYLLGAMLAVILLDSKLNMWWGGTVLGPRYVAEVTPILAYFLAFGGQLCGRAWKRCLFAILAVWSVYANGLIAFAFDGSWERQADLWSWANSPIVYYSHHGFDFFRSLGPAFVRHMRQLPDSRNRSGLAADLQITALPREMLTHSYIDVKVAVKNAGNVVWRRETPDWVGTVRLGWRWHQLGKASKVFREGRGPLLATDLLPASRATISSRIWAPAEPDVYELELGMVSEAVGWFGVDGGPPIRVVINVVGESLCHLEKTLAVMTDPTEPPVHLQWVSDRLAFGPDEAFSVRLNIMNPGPARVLYPVIILQWPSAGFSFLDVGRQTFVDLCSGWIEPAPAIFLDHGYRAVELPLLSLLPWKMPVGRYTLYFLYLRPTESTMHLVAMTALDFERLP
jgi:hypothetical protein